MQRLLIVYASVEGQSAKIAEQIARDVRSAGSEAIVADAKRLTGLPACDGVIVVASVHMGRHARSVEAFVCENREWLRARPSAFLSVSLSAASERVESRRGAQEMLERFLASSGWQPTLARTVAGAIRYSRYGFFKRRILRAKSRAEGGPTDLSRDTEYTDWAALQRLVNEFVSTVEEEAAYGPEDARDRATALGSGTDIPAKAPKHDTLLRDFDKTAQLVGPFLRDRYGVTGAAELYRDAREKYEKIIPQVTWIPGARGRVLNGFLRITAQEIAVYLAVKEGGETASRAWEICHEAIRLRMVAFPRWKRWLLNRFMFSGVVRRIVRRREEKGERVLVGDFEIGYLTSDKGDFDFGVDYVQCGNLELAKALGAEEFAPFVCMSDIALSDALGWGLIRTQSLADGCSHCDFRFKRGGETRICSKTPEVQETIDRIESGDNA